MADKEFIHERTCPVCNKKFIPAPYHAYRVSEKGKLVCSYSCVLENRKRRTEKGKYIKRNEKGETEK